MGIFLLLLHYPYKNQKKPKTLFFNRSSSSKSALSYAGSRVFYV